MDHISSIGTELSKAVPRELAVRNMARRVIGIIREEAENNGMGDLFQAALETGNYLIIYLSERFLIIQYLDHMLISPPL